MNLNLKKRIESPKYLSTSFTAEPGRNLKKRIESLSFRPAYIFYKRENLKKRIERRIYKVPFRVHGEDGGISKRGLKVESPPDVAPAPGADESQKED